MHLFIVRQPCSGNGKNIFHMFLSEIIAAATAAAGAWGGWRAIAIRTDAPAEGRTPASPCSAEQNLSN